MNRALDTPPDAGLLQDPVILLLIAGALIGMNFRITSYNVCYTKLLRALHQCPCGGLFGHLGGRGAVCLAGGPIQGVKARADGALRRPAPPPSACVPPG